jgi:protoheme IX farnesyltransferase
MSTSLRATRARFLAHERTSLYIELTKPRITLMVLLTVALGYMLAPSAAGPWALVHALIGSALSCSGAGALNQYLERDRDGFMDRTRFRPLPAHKVSPAMVLFLGSSLAAGGVTYLAATTNSLTAGLDAATLVSYLFIYTPMKRVSSLSTPAGAIPGALPPVMGWAAASGGLDAGAFVLFGILFLWQIPHFLAIGRLYKDDYANAGFPMLVVVDPSGDAVGRQMILYAIALAPFALAPTQLGLAGPLYFWAALLSGAAYVAASVLGAIKRDRKSARNLLLTSVLYLPLLFAAMLLDRMLLR